MDLDDEYNLALKRWAAATLKWANENCLQNGSTYDTMTRLDARLEQIANKCVDLENYFDK